MVKKIKLNSKKHGNKFALVDNEDYEWLNQYTWFIIKAKIKSRNLYYAHTKIKNKNGQIKLLAMHRLILNAQKGQICDHINGDGLDNRKENLRIVTYRENSQNRHCKTLSKYPGVTWSNYGNNWTSSIRKGNKYKFLGHFKNENDAYNAYLKAIDELDEGKNISELTTYPPKTSSQYTGVCWDKQKNKWKAALQINKKRKHLGLFKTEYEAHLAYEEAKNESNI